MHRIDDAFLDAHGLAALPRPSRTSLIEQLVFELERLVGREITDGLTASQLDEFSGIIDGHPRVLARFLAQHRPYWQTDADYLRIAHELGPDRPLTEGVTDFATRAWLDVNRPDFRTCVAAGLDQLAAHVRARADDILRDVAAGRPVALVHTASL